MSIELILGDCLEVMKTLPDKSIDLFMCDLPYGALEKTANKYGALKNKVSNTYQKNEWDEKLDLNKFWIEVYRLRKSDNSPVIFFCQGKFMVEAIDSNSQEFKLMLIWNKGQVTNFFNAGRCPLHCYEPAIVFSKKLPFYNRIDYDGYCPSTMLNIKRVPGKEKSHPTQKPEELYKRIISWYCPEGGTMLDPTCGSCASLIAGAKLGMNCIGIEKSEKYYNEGLVKLNALEQI